MSISLNRVSNVKEIDVFIDGNEDSRKAFPSDMKALEAVRDLMEEYEVQHADVFCGKGGELTGDDTRTLEQTGFLKIQGKSISKLAEEIPVEVEATIDDIDEMLDEE